MDNLESRGHSTELCTYITTYFAIYTLSFISLIDSRHFYNPNCTIIVVFSLYHPIFVCTICTYVLRYDNRGRYKGGGGKERKGEKRGGRRIIGKLASDFPSLIGSRSMLNNVGGERGGTSIININWCIKCRDMLDVGASCIKTGIHDSNIETIL